MNRSQVMQTLSYLSDVIGPRLTASPGMKRANEWTRDQLTKWGLQNAHLEPWGPFGRGWTLKRFSAQVIEPTAFPLIAYPKAWSPGFASPLTADVVYIDAQTEADLEKFKGKLNGKIVLTAPMREVAAHFEAQGTRLNEKELLALADAPEPRPGGNRRKLRPQSAIQSCCSSLPMPSCASSRQKARRCSSIQAVVMAARSSCSQRSSVAATRSKRDWTSVSRHTSIRQEWTKGNAATRARRRALQPHRAHVAGRRAGEDDCRSCPSQWQDADLMGYNTIAEIPGTDLKDEIVMLGGHMDSWHSGTGATDNAAGVSVAMEAVRIIQALGLKPRRTIRVALWSGEEQGLLGSRAYVAEHFGSMQNPATSAAPATGSANTNGNGQWKRKRECCSGRANACEESRVREAECLLQSRQRHRQDSRSLPARQ